MTFNDIIINDRGSFMNETLFFPDNGCTLHHVACFTYKIRREDNATFTKPVDFNVEHLPFVARNCKIYLDFMKSQKLVPAKSSQSQNRKILYSQIIVTIRYVLRFVVVRDVVKVFPVSSSSFVRKTTGRNTAIWATHKVYWAGDVTGMGVSSLFRSPATLDRNNSVTVAPVHFLFCYNKPEVESFRSRVRLSKSSKN